MNFSFSPFVKSNAPLGESSSVAMSIRLQLPLGLRYSMIFSMRCAPFPLAYILCWNDWIQPVWKLPSSV